MNKLLHLLFIDLKLLSKTKVFYLKLILFPCILILILGTMFGNSNSKITSFNVAFYSEDNAITQNSKKFSLGEALENNVLKSKDAQGIFNFKKVNSYAEGENKTTQNHKISEDKIQSIIKKIQNTDTYTNKITKISTNKNTKPINIMQYESIAMIVMFSILTAFELAHNIVDDKLNNTQFRIKSTPTLDIQYALGKVLGIVLAIVIQMSIVMFLSNMVFGVNFGNIFDILLTTLSYGFTIGTIVFCAGVLAKDQMSISSFAPIILYGFSFLGGSFVNKDNFPSSLKMVQQIIPNGKAINCYLKICQGGSISDIYINLLELIGIGLIFLIISLVLYSERSLTKNANINNDKESIKAAI